MLLLCNPETEKFKHSTLQNSTIVGELCFFFFIVLFCSISLCYTTKLISYNSYHVFFLSFFFHQMAAVAALCVQYEGDFRPNMSIVVKALSPLLHSRSGNRPSASSASLSTVAERSGL